MELNANLTKLYENFKNQQSEGKTKALKREAKDLLKEENLFDINGDGKVDYADLTAASAGMDLSKDGQICAKERAFFDKYKSKLCKAIVKELKANKNDMTIEDLMNFENSVSELNDDDKKTAKKQIAKVEKRLKKYAKSNIKNKEDFSQDDLNNFWETTYNASELNNTKLSKYIEKLETKQIKRLLKNDETLTQENIDAAKEETILELKRRLSAKSEQLEVSEETEATERTETSEDAQESEETTDGQTQQDASDTAGVNAGVSTEPQETEQKWAQMKRILGLN